MPLLSGSDLYELTAADADSTGSGGQPLATFPFYWGLTAASVLFLLLVVVTAVVVTRRYTARRKRGEDLAPSTTN